MDLKKDFKPIAWALIRIAVLINGASGWLLAKLDTPFYLDTIGTIFVAVIADPFAGALTGVLTNIILEPVMHLGKMLGFWSKTSPNVQRASGKLAKNEPFCSKIITKICENHSS